MRACENSLRASFTLCAVTIGAIACSGGGTVGGIALVADVDMAHEWPSHGRTHSEQRYSPLAQINEGNVASLGLAWTYETGSRRGLEATPIVRDGVLFATSSWSVVFALDAATGDEIWRHDPGVAKSVGAVACCDVVNRGVAIHGGRVYAGILDGRLIALDATSGELIWSTQTTDPSKPYTITGAPRVVGDLIVIGNGGAELGVRGFVSAYDAHSGELVWRFYTVPGDPSKPPESPALERAMTTWSGGEWWKIGGGGTVWDSMAHDPELDLLYVGTGNGAPWVRRLRSPGGGDNLYLSTILALRPRTGELVWHYQTTPGDSWDYTATQHLILADLTIDGQRREVLLQAPKNGFFYVLDRATGELISAENYVPVSWAEGVDLATGRPIEAATARYGTTAIEIRPAPSGGHNWHPMAYHPGTGLVYIPAQEVPYVFREDPDFEYRPGAWNTGADLVTGALSYGGGEVSGFLQAWDPVEQREVWRVRHRRPSNGGVLATGGNLVFQGTGHATLEAYRATDGRTLFTAPAGTGVMAPPITYRAGGEQFIVLLAGWGGGYGLGGADPPQETLASGNRGRVLAFKLGGNAQLPAPQRSARNLQPIETRLDPERIERGTELFHRWCAACHGPGAVGGGAIADVRTAPPAVYDQLSTILLDGAYLGRGMPSFGEWLDEDDVSAVRDYLLSRRAALLAGE